VVCEKEGGRGATIDGSGGAFLPYIQGGEGPTMEPLFAFTKRLSERKEKPPKGRIPYSKGLKCRIPKGKPKNSPPKRKKLQTRRERGRASSCNKNPDDHSSRSERKSDRAIRERGGRIHLPLPVTENLDLSRKFNVLEMPPHRKKKKRKTS